MLLETAEDVARERCDARCSLGTIAIGAASAAIAFVAPVVVSLIVPSAFIALTMRERDPQRAVD